MKNENIYKTSVYYEDTDAAGIVYHTSYLRFAERARTEFLNNIYPECLTFLKENRNVLVLRNIEVKFCDFCYLFDKVYVKSYITELQKTHFKMNQIIKKECIVVCDISLSLVFVNLLKKKPVKMDEELVSRLKKTMYKQDHG